MPDAFKSMQHKMNLQTLKKESKGFEDKASL